MNWEYGESRSPPSAGEESGTQQGDLPEAILHAVFAAVEDTRTRNAMALVCRRWLDAERATRSSLALRGNVRDLFLVPTCFTSVAHLDLSLLSPWGYPVLPEEPLEEQRLLALRLRQAFPSVVSLVVYARGAAVAAVLASQWPRLKRVKLVRWHQRPNSEVGAELAPLLRDCASLAAVDLSSFYCWTEDIPPALQTGSRAAASLSRLDLLGLSSGQGFNSSELVSISAACPNLNHLAVSCLFNPRMMGFVGDEALLGVAANCPRLKLLHLLDTSALASSREEEEEDEAEEESRITHRGLEDMFRRLPMLEDLALEMHAAVRESGPLLEVLGSRCSNIRALGLGKFQGVCRAAGLHLDGVAVCGRLRTLRLKSVADLTDAGLATIARGCSRLAELEIQACQAVTKAGVRKLAVIRQDTLVEVSISRCRRLTVERSLWALEPARAKIEALHIECVWEEAERDEEEHDEVEEEEDEEDRRSRKRLKVNWEGEEWEWRRLRRLSLWVAVGEVLNPLAEAGLESCPRLEEMTIKVEGDCRRCARPSPRSSLGLESLAIYPRLRKMKLDCGEAHGYALTAPMGHMDLSLWERFFLWGIGDLPLEELDYWPPQDRDMNQRGLSLPAAGQLAQCAGLRKLFIHGTAHEHFMRFLLKLYNIRDVQLREDYYPAPESDTSTEMRFDSCSRFEAALNRRYIPD